MKIFVNARFLTQPLSGVQRYGIECSRQIKKLYPETVFLSPPDIIHKDIADELGAVVTGKNTGHLWEQISLPRYLKRSGNVPLINLANTAPLLYKNNYITLHDLAFFHHPEWNSKAFATWYNFLIPRIVSNCRHLFTVSNTIKDEIVACYKIRADKVSVTYNGISKDMQNVERFGEKKKIILAVGSFNIRKNHQLLISAFLRSSIKDKYQLVVVGDKHSVFRDTKLDEQELSDNHVKICTGFSDGELRAMYQQADAVASLSLYEGFGIPLLEGLYFNCKVLCSDIPVYREIYNEFAAFCDPLNIDEVVKALNNVDQMLRPAVSDGYEDMFNCHSYRKSAEMILETVLNK